MSELVTARLGLRFAPDRWPELARGIAETCAELGVADVEAWVDTVLGGLPTVAQLQALARRLTTGESYFFRQPEVFRHLGEHVIPELVERRRRSGRLALRTWIAGCATGEEAYSVAILLRQTIPDLAAWDVVIHANDLNPAALAKAAEGKYSEWSFRTTPDDLRARFFQRLDAKHWVVAPEVRRMVRFSYLNLAEPNYPPLFGVPGLFDLIFCRNVLMYFAADRQEPVLRRLRDALASDGRLVLGPCDASLVVHELFERDREQPTVFRRPREPRAAETRAVAELAPALERPAEPPRAAVVATLASAAPAEPSEALPGIEFFDAARNAADRGEHERALALSEEAIAHDKVNPAHHFLRACILIELGRLAEAEAALRSAVFLDPTFVIAHFALGTLARQQGRDDVARRHFRRTEELLAEYHAGDPLPGSDGLTAARLQAIIEDTVLAPQ